MKVKKGKQISTIDRSFDIIDQVPQIKEKAVEESTKSVIEFKTVAEQVAKSTVYFKNFYVPELREKFKFHDRMKRIDKVFPYAKLDEKSAPIRLFVDEPITDSDRDICYQKRSHMKALGLFYLIIEKDTKIVDALEQLGVI